MRAIHPLALIYKSYTEGILDTKTYQQTIKRIGIVNEAVNRIEYVTTVKFPDFVIEPSLVIGSSDIEYGQPAILYARTIPYPTETNQIRIIIQLCAPLVLYGLKGTIHAVMAHEFLHYLNLVKNILEMKINSDLITVTSFEASFIDDEKTLNAKRIFKRDRSLIKMLDLKFDTGLHDSRLDTKTQKMWINKNKPIQSIPLSKNYSKLPFAAFSNTKFDDHLMAMIEEWS
jgi:hypothetical protein